MLVVGSGGVGSAIAAIAERRSFFDHMALADRDGDRARRAVSGLEDRDRFSSLQLDASDPQGIVAAAQQTGADVIVNAADPRLNPQIFSAAFEARCTYLDMAMTLSEPHPERPYEEPGVKLGDGQFARARTLAESAVYSRSSGSASNRVSPTSSPATRPITSFHRSTRSVFATGQTSSSRATLSPRRSRSGRPSRSV